MISVDFVIELPKSTGFNTVIIVVDLVFKKAYFISTHIIVTMENTARLFLYHI